MSDSAQVGQIGWIDMTVADAPLVRDFYKAVVGYETDEIDMGGYSDYVMKMPSSGSGVSGIYHARGLFCVVEDPAGSVAGLYQPKSD
jgi:predicted enzyme related to lactoylglutathione lyase